MKLILEIRNIGSAQSWKEDFDADQLMRPDSIGKRAAKKDVRVTTQAEAESYGRALVDAFNSSRQRHVLEPAREFVGAELKAEPEPQERRADDGRRNIVPGVCPECHGIDDAMPDCIRCDGTGCICERCGESCDPGESYCDDCRDEWEDEDADTDGTDSTEEESGL